MCSGMQAQRATQRVPHQKGSFTTPLKPLQFALHSLCPLWPADREHIPHVCTMSGQEHILGQQAMSSKKSRQFLHITCPTIQAMNQQNTNPGVLGNLTERYAYFF